MNEDTQNVAQDNPAPTVEVVTEPSTPPAVVAPTPSATKPSKTPKWRTLPVLAGLALVVVGGGAYGYFGIYMQSPEQLWNAAVKNTGDGLKQYIDTMPAPSKATLLSGNFKVSSPVVIDGTLTAAVDDTNFTATQTVGVSGLRLTADVRGITASGATSPDFYVKLDGVKGLVGLLGPNYADIGKAVDSVNGKWLLIDHTLADQAKSSVTQSSSALSSAEIRQGLQDASKKVTQVLSDRLFTSDKSKAVVTMTENVAKEDFKGRSSQHVKVKVNKQQLHDMVVALKDGVKETKVKEWVMSTDKSKTFEEAISFDSLLKQVDKANYDNTVTDVWIDSSLKYVRNVRIPLTDDNNKSIGTLDILVDYKGGDDIPVSMTIAAKDATSEGTIALGMTLKKKSNDIVINATVDLKMDAQKVVGSAEYTLKGSGDAVKVEKPADATNIMNLLGSYLGDIQTLQKQVESLKPAALDDTQL